MALNIKNPFKTSFLHVSLKDRVLFVNHLSIAIRSGMSLIDGLSLIKKQSTSKSLIKILDVLIKDVNGGAFLSTGLEKFQHIFGPLFINMIRVGEQSGTLTENLKYLAEELKKRSQLLKKVRGALIYPAVLLTLTLIIAIGMILFVFPKILSIFESFNAELPLTTRLLIKVYELLTMHWIAIIGVVVLIPIVSYALLRVYKIKYYFHWFLILIPVFGTVTIKINVANITRTLGLLLRSGVKIVEAVLITADTTDNLVYKKALQNAANTAKTGEYLSKYFGTKPRLFPVIMTNMIAVGENTGNLTENLSYLSEFYADDVDDLSKNLSVVLEPLLLLVMGGMVAFIALSVVLPIYQLTQAIN